MSAIIEIQQRIEGTNALIAEYEKSALRPNAPPSLSINIRSLEKSKRELELDFEELARREELDVCRYRLLTDAQPTLASVSSAWGRFQDLFSSVYDALKNGPRKQGQIAKHDLAATQFGFGFTFEGSVGVALTLPMKDAGTDLQAAVMAMFEMAKAQNAEALATFVERLGIPPIVRLKRWVKAHTKSRSGAIIEWHPTNQPITNLHVQYQEFIMLQNAIQAVSEPKIVELPMPGLLIGASVRKRKFEMKLDTGEEIEGTFGDAINQEHAVTLPKHYQALIRKTTKIKEATEEEEISYFLVRLGRQMHT
jgi:hypothetical protein